MNTLPPESAHPMGDNLAGIAAGDFELKNGIVFYRGARPFEELDFPAETEADAADYTWAQQDPQVRHEYGGLIVVVRGRRVWGAGKTGRAAWEQASQVVGCPPRDELLFVVVPGSPA